MLKLKALAEVLSRKRDRDMLGSLPPNFLLQGGNLVKSLLAAWHDHTAKTMTVHWMFTKQQYEGQQTLASNIVKVT